MFHSVPGVAAVRWRTWSEDMRVWPELVSVCTLFTTALRMILRFGYFLSSASIFPRKWRGVLQYADTEHPPGFTPEMILLLLNAIQLAKILLIL
jgi:hypothetical protein